MEKNVASILQSEKWRWKGSSFFVFTVWTWELDESLITLKDDILPSLETLSQTERPFWGSKEWPILPYITPPILMSQWTKTGHHFEPQDVHVLFPPPSHREPSGRARTSQCHISYTFGGRTDRQQKIYRTNLLCWWVEKYQSILYNEILW